MAYRARPGRNAPAGEGGWSVLAHRLRPRFEFHWIRFGFAQTKLPGYAQAKDAFMHLTLDERDKLQVLLTAAGYWPAVPNADFSTSLFNAILQFEVDNRFVPLGVLNNQQMDRLAAIQGRDLNSSDVSSL